MAVLLHKTALSPKALLLDCICIFFDSRVRRLRVLLASLQFTPMGSSSLRSQAMSSSLRRRLRSTTGGTSRRSRWAPPRSSLSSKLKLEAFLLLLETTEWRSTSTSRRHAMCLTWRRPITRITSRAWTTLQVTPPPTRLFPRLSRTTLSMMFSGRSARK